MTNRPKALELFCGAGGSAVGYSRAGFDVTGVDLRPQPNFPFRFVQADALRYVAEHGHEYECIFSSPPCQHYAGSTAWRGDRNNHPDLIGPTRELLLESGLPYVIENVPDARRHLINPVMLCGTHFGLKVKRHRFFETNWPLPVMSLGCDHRGILPFEHKGERAYADALGCDWMTSVEARQAIPPAMTELIGTQLLQHISSMPSPVAAELKEGIVT